VTDTQWPRFYVFKQDTPETAHLNCGSVHASDAEMALLNARDVFVRRPDCVSLWVAPAGKVAQVTADGLAALVHSDKGSEAQAYEVFTKPAGKGQHAHVGQVTASSPEEALHLAAAAFSQDVRVWWVVPSKDILASPQDEGAAWFEAARDKPFRHQTFYRTERLIREIKAGQHDSSEDGQ
jgi:ring-1,2-phenylacetyl-CoA epoxidase subunit PaaB